jgi:HPt (histidine-containing phosphotransfer) domain-containing protein
MTAGDPASPDPQTPGSPAIDRSVLGEWLAGDDAAIDELLVVFRDSILADQLRLAETLGLGDLVECANAAHRLRGAALSMGARALAAVAGQLHAAAKEQNAAGCHDGMVLLEVRVRLMLAEVPPIGARP